MSDWLPPPLAFLFSTLHTVLALAVSIHVLLRKREAGSAIAWMGLAWLSPGIGVILYLLFGINRVHRKAYRIRSRRELPRLLRLPDAPRRSDHLAPLELAVDSLTGSALPPGNRIDLLRDGEETYPAMLEAIDRASTSIALASYIFEMDDIGRSFVAALARARERGVAIRVIVDGVGSGYLLSPAYRAMSAQGIEVARFLHSLRPWRMGFLNLRNHKKILVVDGRMAFVGGLNISIDHLPGSDPPHPIRDVHFRVTGPAVTQIAEAFAADWYFAVGEELSGESWIPQLGPAGTAEARVITSGPDQDPARLSLLLQQAINCARHSIALVTPYFLPEERLVTSLMLAAMRGVAVDIVLPQSSDNLLVDWATRAHVAPLLEAGCRIWRAPRPFDHSKLLSIDGEWSLIGSANWDVRSLRLNFEISLEVYDRDFARLIEQQVMRRQGRRLTLRGLSRRSLSIRLRDAAARLLLPYL